MAGGPIFPFSAVPRTAGKVFPNVHKGNTNSKLISGLGVMASLDADATYDLLFQMPPSIPSGTPKLILLALANATANSAKVNPKWSAVSRSGGNPDTASLTAEGTSTVTWASGDNDDFKETKITLDATTAPAAEQVLVMELVFETSSWTLAAVSTWIPYVIWE